MLVPPAPWRSANTGAHLTMRSFVMRTGEQLANRRLLEATDRDMADGKPGASQVHCAERYMSVDTINSEQEADRRLLEAADREMGKGKPGASQTGGTMGIRVEPQEASNLDVIGSSTAAPAVCDGGQQTRDACEGL